MQFLHEAVNQPILYLNVESLKFKVVLVLVLVLVLSTSTSTGTGTIVVVLVLVLVVVVVVVVLPKVPKGTRTPSSINGLDTFQRNMQVVNLFTVTALSWMPLTISTSWSEGSSSSSPSIFVALSSSAWSNTCCKPAKTCWSRGSVPQNLYSRSPPSKGWL